MSTAREMIDMLRRHYLPENREPGGIFAPEIQAPGSTRRADLIWQGCTAAGGHELVGHEVKVTRADLLNELAEPAKSDPWQRYCDRWWLVLSDPALMDGLDIPPSWGVLAPPSGRRTRSMTVLVPAPQLKPVEQSPAFKTLAVWLHWRAYRAEGAQRHAETELQYARENVVRLNSQLDRSGTRETPTSKVIADIISGLGGVRGDRIGSWDGVTVEDVVTALKDLAAVEAKRVHAEDNLRYLTERLRGLRDSVGRVLSEVGQES